MSMSTRSRTVLAWALWLVSFGCCAGGLAVTLAVTRPLTVSVLAEGAVGGVEPEPLGDLGRRAALGASDDVGHDAPWMSDKQVIQGWALPGWARSAAGHTSSVPAVTSWP